MQQAIILVTTSKHSSSYQYTPVKPLHHHNENQTNIFHCRNTAGQSLWSDAVAPAWDQGLESPSWKSYTAAAVGNDAADRATTGHPEGDLQDVLQCCRKNHHEDGGTGTDPDKLT